MAKDIFLCLEKLKKSSNGKCVPEKVLSTSTYPLSGGMIESDRKKPFLTLVKLDETEELCNNNSN